MSRYVARRDNEVTFWCPGCIDIHTVNSNAHTVTGNGKRLTVNPSILTTGGSANIVCHAYLTRGVWMFLSDSTHALSGSSCTMVELPDDWTAGIHGAVFDE